MRSRNGGEVHNAAYACGFFKRQRQRTAFSEQNCLRQSRFVFAEGLTKQRGALAAEALYFPLQAEAAFG